MGGSDAGERTAAGIRPASADVGAIRGLSDSDTIAILCYVSDLLQELRTLAQQSQLEELAKMLDAAALHASHERLERQSQSLRKSDRGRSAYGADGITQAAIASTGVSQVPDTRNVPEVAPDERRSSPRS